MDILRDRLLHKVIITKEAKFDFEECLEHGEFPNAEIKKLVEEYLYIKQLDRRHCQEYFRLKYFDEAAESMLMLFIKKAHRFGTTQGWYIAGICLATDYDEDFEYRGKNKVWYESPVDITAMPKDDWVKDIGERKENIQRCKILGVRKELENAILYGGHKKIT